MMMHKIMLKPFSQNKARRGKQWKTEACEKFMYDLKILLQSQKKGVLPKSEFYEIHYIWGFSNFLNSDIDNPIKTAQDVIATHYGIDDRYFVAGSQRKVKVAKGDEFITFMIRPYNPVMWAQFTQMG